MDRLVSRKKIYVIAATYKEDLFIRFVVCSRLCETRDIEFAWKEISEQATEILRDNSLSEKIIEEVIEPGKETANITAMIEGLKIKHDLKENAQKIS